MLISIHTPAKGVTGIKDAMQNAWNISIHTPAKGVTNAGYTYNTLPGNFNPHSREGSDNLKAIYQITVIKFQSTLPRRE